jgi:hypothetical protein
MSTSQDKWENWAKFFLNRSNRVLPALEQDRDYSSLPASLAKSLAIFQLGESGGGTIIKQSLHNDLPGTNEYYAAAMALFVEEEHRHANILAMCVRQLGGELIRSNWTAKLFVFARRLIGLRLKVVVLLAAEVVGLCYYHLLAVQLPPSRLRDQLLDIVEDERSHLYFHCDFLRSQTPTRWRKRLFIVVWRAVMFSAAIVVAIDHRKAIRDLDIGVRKVLQRWQSYSGLAESLVTADASEFGAKTSVTDAGAVGKRVENGLK